MRVLSQTHVYERHAYADHLSKRRWQHKRDPHHRRPSSQHLLNGSATLIVEARKAVQNRDASVQSGDRHVQLP